MKKEKKAADAGESFEEGLGRLDEVVKRIEDSEIPLEEAIRLYEEGTRLHRKLEKVLENAKLRIEKLEAAQPPDGTAKEGEDEDDGEGTPGF